MRKLLMIALLASGLLACKSSPKNASEIRLDDFKQRISYALGADIGVNFTNFPEDIFALFDKEEIADGFYTILADSKLDAEECDGVLRAAFETGMVDTTEYSMSEISHCYGAVFGEMLRSSLESKDAMKEIDLDIVKIGFMEALYETDTLIDVVERQQMILDFNNDLNKAAGEKFMAKLMKEHKSDVQEDGYILIEHEPGTGDLINLSYEYDILYTLVSMSGDTIISTITNLDLPEAQNTQTVSSDDIVFPEAWKLAAEHMRVGGSYTIHTDYEYGFGDDGLRSPNSNNFIIQPYAAFTIHTKVFSQQEQHSKVRELAEQMLENAKKRANTVVDPSGFVLTTLEEGTGRNVPEGGDVQAHYTLTNSYGDVVEDSRMASAQSGQPAPTFSLEGVIQGWKLGIPKMKEGGRYILTLPYDLAYGEFGNQGVQPYETLEFDIEIVKAGQPGELTGSQGQQQITEEQLRELQRQLELQQAE